MRKLRFLILTIFSLVFLNDLPGEAWDQIHLPNEFVVPTDLNRNVYSTQLPTSPLLWIQTTECNTYQPTSIHWKSDFIKGIKGISFKGLVFKLPELKNQGNSLNSFAVFFHENGCYVGGSEYGWFFSESDLPQAQFYLCSNCNIRGEQKWVNWPGDGIHVLEGDASGVKKALENSGIYRYWNISITPAGNFILDLINPSNYKKVSVTLKKPDWFPVLYNTPGYVTITAKKQIQQTVYPAPYMHVDDVKVLQ